jgi:hypothetical protein
MKSLWHKIEHLHGMVDTIDLTEQESAFVRNVHRRCLPTGDTRILTEKQVQWLEDLHERHFGS